MTSSGSRPPESSQTSHRCTRCRVTWKFGFAGLTPARSSMNTRVALYRGPPIASQYSWYDARYAVGFSWPSSHRTPVTVATRTGKCSRIFRAIRGSVWIGRIGIVKTPFFAALGSASHRPFFSRSNCARASWVSKKIGRPSWPQAWQTKVRLSLSIPAIGPITRSFGWTCPLPQWPHAAKSFGPKRPTMAGPPSTPMTFTPFPSRSGQVDTSGTAALGDDLLDHLLAEDLKLRLLAGARHVRNSPTLV